MPTPRDTRQDPPELILAAGLLGGVDGVSTYITEQERNGQHEVVASTVIPRELLYCTEDDLTALGFTLGDPTDDLFREATLPAGWRREGSDRAMWSHIVDEHGRDRAAVFYKAAFYDRKAHISITSLHGYVYNCAAPYEDAAKPVVYDDEWATPAAVAQVASAAADEEERRAKEMRSYYPQGVPEKLRAVDRLRAIAAEAQGRSSSGE